MDVPQHIGFILDGNRRWAKANNLPTIEGHRQGYETLQTISKYAFERGVKYISAYAFSSENWQRSKDEVQGIMKLLSWALKNEVQKYHSHNFRLRIIGRRDRFSASVAKQIAFAEELTAANTAGTVVLCLDYSGKQEILDAVQSATRHGVATADLTIDTISDHLYAPDVPFPDMIIRTSGERRLSDYLLWQSSYSELLFVDKNWPDFTTEDLESAFIDYSERNRRFGR